jgi:pSer/pThr/pTyr-binding forkhead associated (FHA) protein
MASLIMASGPRLGESFWLGDRVNIIGSGRWASLQVFDRGVSQEHLTIRRDPATGYFVVSPMDPNNPVYINGRQTTSDRRLFEEDHILIGNTVLEFTEKERGGFRKDTGPSAATAAVVRESEAEEGPAFVEQGPKEIWGWRVVRDETGMTFERFTESLETSTLLNGLQ